MSVKCSLLRRVAVASAAVVLSTGCGTSGGDEAATTTTRSPSGLPSTTSAPAQTSTSVQPDVAEVAPVETAPVPEPSDPEPVSLTGAQVCGSVISVSGALLVVEILSGEVDCTFAEDLLDTYYNDPPTIPEGSGAFVTIGAWECNSSATQEAGRGSTCRGPGGGEIITQDGVGG